jgi:hypothetical protein
LASAVSLLQQRGIDVGSEIGKDIVNALANGISVEVRRQVEAKRAAMMRDKDFVRKFNDGDQECRRQMTTINALMSAKIIEGAA